MLVDSNIASVQIIFNTSKQNLHKQFFGSDAKELAEKYAKSWFNEPEVKYIECKSSCILVNNA